MDLVEDDANHRINGISIYHLKGRFIYRLILGVQTRANGGERSMIANISGTVTRI
jgi:hypothetical protein